MDRDLIDALRDDSLDAAAARALFERAADLPREAWHAIVRDETLPRRSRRLVIRHLLEAKLAGGATLAEAGAACAAEAWLQPTYVRPVSVVMGKLPVQWLAEDLIVTIDVLPSAPSSGDRHRLLAYLRVAGQPDLAEVIGGLQGGPGGGHEVRELGFAETDPPRPERTAAAAAPPRLGTALLCRRALCDAQTGMHTLIDVIVELPAPLPGPAMFDIYLQLRHVIGSASVTLDVFGPGTADDGDEVLLTTGTLKISASANPPPGPPPTVLGVAIPNVTVGFERAGEHRMRIRCGDEVLGDLRFEVVDASGS